MMNFLFNVAFYGFLAAFFAAMTAAVSSRPLWARAREATLALAFLCVTGFLGVRWVEAGRPPMSNLFESLVCFAWCLVLMYWVLRRLVGLPQMAPPVAFIGMVLLGYGWLGSDRAIQPLLPALQNNFWLTTHVLLCFVGYAAFAVALALSVMVVARRDRQSDVERGAYLSVVFGFVFLGAGIATGSVWANVAWGSYWSWDPKETASLVTWLVFAVFLHLRPLSAKRSKAVYWIPVLGFVCVLFTYFGVNYLDSLHSYGSN